MTQEQLDLWLSALESGKYTQYQRSLTSENETEHCCLGVLADVLNIRDNNNQLRYPSSARSYIMDDNAACDCVKLNDVGFIDAYARVIQYVRANQDRFLTNR